MQNKDTTHPPTEAPEDAAKREFDEAIDVVDEDGVEIDVVDEEELDETLQIKAELNEREREPER